METVQWLKSKWVKFETTFGHQILWIKKTSVLDGKFLRRKAVEAGLDGDALNEYVGNNAKAASNALAEAFAKAEEGKEG